MHVEAAIIRFSIDLIVTLSKVRLGHHLLVLNERRFSLLPTAFEALVLGAGAYIIRNRWLINHSRLALLLEPAALLQYVSTA